MDENIKRRNRVCILVVLALVPRAAALGRPITVLVRPPPPRRGCCCLPGCCTFVVAAAAVIGGIIALLCAIF